MRIIPLLIGLAFSSPLFAQAPPRVVVAHGTASYEAPVQAATELGLWKKYGVAVEAIAIPEADQRLAAIFDDTAHFYFGGATAPLRAFSSGADIVLLASALNRPPWSIVAQHEIVEPSGLAGKKIAVAEIGGASALAAAVALRRWGVPVESVTLVPIRGGVNRLVALATKKVDAALLAPPESFIAGKSNLPVLANLADLQPAAPLDVIAARRSFLVKNRAAAKRVLQALGAAIHILKTERAPSSKVYEKTSAEDEPIAAAGLYFYYAPHFSLPPRIDREGLRLAAERAGAAGDTRRMIDESILDELVREGFFKR
jgi:ABC-type nitrate/sulfonate/bicarbonate transport system substrate-binding protein